MNSSIISAWNTREFECFSLRFARIRYPVTLTSSSEAAYEELIGPVSQNRVGLTHSLVDQKICAQLHSRLWDLHQQDELHRAGVGKDTTIAQTIRSDQIYWIDTQRPDQVEQDFLDQVWQFVAYLNQTCFTAINDVEFMLALYQPGAHYQRHRDQFAVDSGRKFSLITYLNPNWSVDYGGQLQVFGSNDQLVMEVNPVSTTTVFFRSDQILHAVAPTLKPRLSVTGWLLSR